MCGRQGPRPTPAATHRAGAASLEVRSLLPHHFTHLTPSHTSHPPLTPHTFTPHILTPLTLILHSSHLHLPLLLTPSHSSHLHTPHTFTLLTPLHSSTLLTPLHSSHLHTSHTHPSLRHTFTLLTPSHPIPHLSHSHTFTPHPSQSFTPYAFISHPHTFHTHTPSLLTPHRSSFGVIFRQCSRQSQPSGPTPSPYQGCPFPPTPPPSLTTWAWLSINSKLIGY